MEVTFTERITNINLTFTERETGVQVVFTEKIEPIQITFTERNGRDGEKGEGLDNFDTDLTLLYNISKL